MDTNNKQFQDALQNLTTAFFQFLQVVNPKGVSREADILYISQSLQTIASHLCEVGEFDLKVVQPQQMSQMAPLTQASQPTLVKEVSTNTNPSLPQQPNLFREQPFFDKRSALWVFDRPRPQDGDTKLFKLYTNDTEGEFEMKPISSENWQNVFESREKILPSQVVMVDGEITASAQSTPVERGILRKEGNIWRVVKPCRIRVTSV